MPDQSLAFLNNLAVREALKQAWQDSNPGVSGGHEEGGFVLQASSGILSVARWPSGAQSSILCRRTRIANLATAILLRHFIHIQTQVMIICKSQARQTRVLFVTILI